MRRLALGDVVWWTLAEDKEGREVCSSTVTEAVPEGGFITCGGQAVLVRNDCAIGDCMSAKSLGSGKNAGPPIRLDRIVRRATYTVTL